MIEIKLPYNIEYVNIVATFVEEVGAAHGASVHEKNKLRLLAEEAFLFIVKGVPKFGITDMFSLKCIIEDDGLLMSFSSHGIPLYDRCKENNKDIYDSEQAGIAILKGISDMCEYINRGSDGWSILISKRLDSIKILKEQDYKELEELTKLASAEKLTIERANSSHVKSIIDLMYRTYRYSYAKSAFYYEDVLSKGIEDSSILSIIAVNNKGEVVGQNAAISENGLSEIGMLMVDPIYRTNRALLLLVRNSARLFFNDNIKNTIYYSKCVTTHTDSQAVATLFSLVPSALKLSSYAQASFIGISSDSNIRESLIYYVRLQNIENNNKVFYIPHKHRKISSIILDKIGINYKYSDEYTKEPFTKEIIEDFNKSKEYATFVVNEIGEDIFIKLKKLNKQALRNGCKTATCEISIEQPLVKDFDSKMMDLGYMFCGLEPTSNLQWRAIYTNLFYQDFNIEDVKLHDKLALDLREYIINLYETIKNK